MTQNRVGRVVGWSKLRFDVPAASCQLPAASRNRSGAKGLGVEELGDERDELGRVDGLREMPLEPGSERAHAVGGPCMGGHRNSNRRARGNAGVGQGAVQEL